MGMADCVGRRPERSEGCWSSTCCIRKAAGQILIASEGTQCKVSVQSS